MEKAFVEYTHKGLTADFDELTESTHMAESSCDDIRRKIATEMFEKALIPESRGEILSLLETIDRVPNQAESLLFMIQSQLMKLPEGIGDKLMRLVHLNRDAFLELAKTVRALFVDSTKVEAHNKAVDKLESASDHLEREIIRSLFADEKIPLGEKILFKELIVELGKISDRSENAGDKIALIAVRRMI
jgi:predicted phosphate transport protein (TIGR00153 family)